MSPHELPYPIRRKNNGWEVVMVHDEAVLGYFHCSTPEEANAIADARPLHGIVMMGGRADLDRVNLCINTLYRHGLDARALLVRMIMSLAER